MSGLGLGAVREQLASSVEEVRREAVARLAVDAGGPDAGAALALLIDAMGDTSWRVRKEAAARAAAWSDRGAAAAALVVALGEPENVGRRNAAVEALVTLGAEGLPALEAALAPRPEHRKVLADTLGLIGDRRAAPLLAPLVADPDANVRVAAAEALGRVGGDEAEAALHDSLGRREKLLVLAALGGLNRMGSRIGRAQIEPLLAEPTLRAGALEALGRGGDASAAPLLQASLEDPARSTREAAIRGLAQLEQRTDAPGRQTLRATVTLSHGALQSLIQALVEGTLGVQRAAIGVLGLAGRTLAVRPLTLALADPELRDAAVQALTTIGAPAVEALVAFAPDLEGRLRADVYRLLPRLGPQAADPHVQALLGEALADEDMDAAAGAAHALGELGGREALAQLMRTLDRDGEVARAAAQALGRLGARHYEEVRILVHSRGLAGSGAPHLCRVLGACGREADVPFLRSALGAEEAAVRRAAAEALAQLPGTVEGDDALLFALADESGEVRAAAARALGLHSGLHSGRVIGSLARAAQDGEVAVRGAAARALGQVAARAEAAVVEQALGVLRGLAGAADAIAAVPALEAIGLGDHPADDGLLIAALAASDAEIVKVAARALSRRSRAASGERVREALKGALCDRRWDVRRAAAQALGGHGPVAGPLLLERRPLEKDALVLEAIDAALKWPT